MNKKAQIRREVFAREYALDRNATRAAIAAGCPQPGAAVSGHRLLKNSKTQKLIDGHLTRRAQKSELTAERVLNELSKLAFFDGRQLYNADGTLKPMTELDDETAAAISGFDIEELYAHFGKGQAQEIGRVKKYKLADKGQNLERLGRYLKLFTEKVEISGDTDILAALSAGRERARNRQKSGEQDSRRD